MKRLLLVTAALLALSSQAFAADTCTVTEYARLAVPGGDLAQVAQEPSIAVQNTPDFTGGAQQTPAAFNSATAYVRVWCNVQTSIAFGTNPTATTASTPLSAATSEYFGVPRGQSYKMSAVVRP